MVRKYSVFIKDNFAKKSSETQKSTTDETDNKIIIENEDSDNIANVNTRYYSEQKLMPKYTSSAIEETAGDPEFDLRSRPKLGSLPSYIAFQDS